MGNAAVGDRGTANPTGGPNTRPRSATSLGRGGLWALPVSSSPAPYRGGNETGAASGVGAFSVPASPSPNTNVRGRPSVSPSPVFPGGRGGRRPGHAAGDGSASAYQLKSPVVPIMGLILAARGTGGPSTTACSGRKQHILYTFFLEF